MQVGAGEHQPAVDEQDRGRDRRRTALLDGHAVAPDLPEPAEEDEADGSHGARRRDRPAAIRAGRRSATSGDQVGVDLGGPRSSHGGSAPIGGRQWPAGWPRWRSIALAGPGFGRLVAGLERPALEQAGVDAAGAGGVAGAPSGRTSRRRRARTQWRGDADQADGADGEQRQRHRVVAAVHLVAVRGGGDEAGRLGRVAGGVLDADDVVDLVGEADEQRRWRPCGRCGPGCRR